VEICVLCGRWFSNQFEIVSETHFSCNTVGHELLWAVLCSLLCPETDWNIRNRRQGCMLFLFDAAYFETEKTWVEFSKWINLINASTLFSGFAKFEIKRWFSPTYQDQFFVWSLVSAVSLDCRLLESFFQSHFPKKETALSFFFLLDCASRTCSMPRQYFFVLLPNHVKYYLTFKTFREFKTQREKLCYWWRESCICPLIDHRRNSINHAKCENNFSYYIKVNRLFFDAFSAG